MNYLRFVTVVFILLILTACAVQNRNQAGRINGTDISYQDFVTAHRGHFDNFMVEKGRTPDSDEKIQLLKQTWRDITIHVILKNQFKRYNITVTNQELLDTLSNSIPLYLQNSPRFMVNGKFDRNLYLQSLQYDTPVNLKPVKEHYYNYLIPIMKLKQKLIDSSMLSKNEYKLISDIVNSTADIDWIVFDPAKVTVNISDMDIQSYYKNNLKDFVTTPRITFEYAIMTINPTADDSLLSQTLADSLYTKIKNGAQFGPLAEQYSTAESAIRGGSLGYVLVMELPKPVKYAIADLDNGQVSEPILIQNHWSIFQVMDKTKSMVKLNEIVIDPRPGAETVDRYRQSIENMGELSNTIGLEKAAFEMDCQYFRTPVMQKDSLWINDLDLVNKVRKELSSVKSGSMLNPIYSQRLSAWVLVNVIDNQTQNYVSLENATKDIISILESTRKIDVAKQMAMSWLSNNASNPSAAAMTEKMQVISTKDQSVNSMLFGSPIKDIYYESVNLYLAKQQFAPYEFNNLIVIPIVSKVNIRKNYSDNPDLVRSCFAKNLPANWFDTWLEDQIRNANVKTWY